MQWRNREIQCRNTGHRVQAEEFTLLERKTVDNQPDTDRQMPQLILRAFGERFSGKRNPYFVNGFPGNYGSEVLLIPRVVATKNQPPTADFRIGRRHNQSLASQPRMNVSTAG